ncbi:hypothetical protein BH23GEM9_BH23GEM9_00320 [soil metagenome]
MTGASSAGAVIVDTSEWKERLIRGFTLLFLSYAGYYLYWRWTASLNPDALGFSVLLAAAETFTLLATAFFVFNVWRLSSHAPPTAARGLTVDVFITTYNEPLEVIRKTALGAKALRYPNRTYLLDDGSRDEVRQLARYLGIEYLTRESNEHAKAGNLNSALRQTDGEFILQLDADHVPLPDMLDRLLGYFQDPKVAFVQSPQTFYNRDRFTTLVRPERRRLFTEQSIFFQVIQRGKDYWNAAFFCGSCAIIRRSALDELGGFSTDTITEDFETSIRLHSRGWKSAYHPEPLAYGLSPTTAAGFHTQRLRWAQGTMQVWRKYNPLTLRGLTLPQRICYFYSILVYLDGLPRIVFYTAPLIYFALGTMPLGPVGPSFLYHFVPLYAGAILLNMLLGRGTAQPFWMLERSNMSKVFTHTAGLTGLAGTRLRFRVTPKGANRTPVAVYAPHIALIALTTAALLWGTWAYKAGIIDYGGAGIAAALAFLLNVGWASWNLGIAAAVVNASVRTHERRVDHRFTDAVAVLVEDGVGETGVGTGMAGGVAVDVNSGGMAIRSLQPLRAGEVRSFVLQLGQGPLRVRGRVQHVGSVTLPHGDVSHGVEFVELCEQERHHLDLHCTHYAVPRFRASFREVEDIFDRVLQPGTPAGTQVNLLAHVGPGDHNCNGSPVVLHSIGANGVELFSTTPLHEHEEVWVEVAGRRQMGTVAATRTIPTAGDPAYLVEVNMEQPHLLSPRGRAISPRKEAVPMLGQRLLNQRATRVAAAIAGMLLATVITAAAAAGQVTGGAILSAEAARDDRTFFLAGGWVTPERAGWAPVGSVMGYRLGYMDQLDNRTIWGLNPAAGIRRTSETSNVQGTVGYAWQWFNEIEMPAAPELQRVTAGVTTSLQTNYWGDGTRAAQGIVSYSWGGDGYLWSQLRASQRVGMMGSTPMRLGAEVSAQGNRDVTALGAGPYLEIPAGGSVVTLASGMRRIDSGGAARNQWYARLDLVVLR